MPKNTAKPRYYVRIKYEKSGGIEKLAKKTNKTIKESKLSGWQKKKASRKKRSIEFNERKAFLQRLKEND